MKNPSIIGNLGPQTKIYRIFPQVRFFELFKEKRNALVQPRKWHDPFENIFLKSPVKAVTGEIRSFSLHDAVYGQCWTRQNASDAMWQIYSKNGDGIRVRTTVGKLIDSLRAAHGDMANESCFIGRVRYERDKQLREFGRSMFVGHRGTEAIAKSLLIKRRAYRHENEVRLVYIASSETREDDLVYKYGLYPLEIFDQVMVDGRVSWDDFVRLKNVIAKRTGLPKRRIKRSLLYTPPKDFVVCIP